MKKYAVLKKIGDFDAKVVREFEDEKDALDFAFLLAKSEESEHIEYFIARDISHINAAALAG